MNLKMEPAKQISIFYLAALSVSLLSASDGVAGPTTGAHSFTNYNLGDNDNLSISSPRDEHADIRQHDGGVHRPGGYFRVHAGPHR